jgi:hypothetical protein
MEARSRGLIINSTTIAGATGARERMDYSVHNPDNHGQRG